MDAAIENVSKIHSGVRPIQVVGFCLLLLAAVAGGLLIEFPEKKAGGEVELLVGAVLGPADLAVIEAVFNRSGLNSYRVDDGRLYVDRGQQSSYLRAVVDAGALPPEFGGSLRRAVESDSPWRSKETQAELVRVATQEELSLVIRTMPGIEQAAVLYSGSNAGSLFREGNARAQTASVSIRTQPELELDRHRVEAIRVLVAASIAGLRVEQVALTDLRSGKVFDGPLLSDAEFITTDPNRARAVAYEQHVTLKIRQALAFIAGVVVEVNASAIEQVADGKKETIVRDVRAAANVPAIVGVGLGSDQGATDVGQVVYVSVAIPETYIDRLREEIYANVEDAASAEIERLRALVVGLVPATEPWGRAVVTITRYPGLSAASAQGVQGVQGASNQSSAGEEEASPAPTYSLSMFLPIGSELVIRSLMKGKLIALYGCLALGLSVVLMWWPRWQMPEQQSDMSDAGRKLINWAAIRRPHQHEEQAKA